LEHFDEQGDGSVKKMFVRDIHSVLCFTTDSLRNHCQSIQSQNYPSLTPSLLYFYYLLALSLHQLQGIKTPENLAYKTTDALLFVKWGRYSQKDEFEKTKRRLEATATGTI